MRSVILISPNDKEIEKLFQQWKNKATNMYVDSETLNMIINGERIYVDYYKNGEADYEDDELVGFDIHTVSFYSICYSDRYIMKHFMQNSNFTEGSFVDNDLGKIVRIDELREEEILKFIQ